MKFVNRISPRVIGLVIGLVIVNKCGEYNQIRDAQTNSFNLETTSHSSIFSVIRPFVCYRAQCRNIESISTKGYFPHWGDKAYVPRPAFRLRVIIFTRFAILPNDWCNSKRHDFRMLSSYNYRFSAHVLDVVWAVSSVTQSIGRVTYLILTLRHFQLQG